VRDSGLQCDDDGLTGHPPALDAAVRTEVHHGFFARFPARRNWTGNGGAYAFGRIHGDHSRCSDKTNSSHSAQAGMVEDPVRVNFQDD
jgi:hypothetical protein